MDDPKEWRKKVKDDEGNEYTVDLVGEFFSNIDLR